MKREDINRLYQGHLAIQARLNNETLSEQLKREKREAAGRKDLIDGVSLIGGSIGMLAPFVFHHPVALPVALMGSAFTASALTSIAEGPARKALNYLIEVKEDMLELIALRGVPIEELQKPIARSKEDLAETAIDKCVELAELEHASGGRFAIEFKYAVYSMTDEQRQYFNKAVLSIQESFRYCLPNIRPNERTEIIAALLESQSGHIKLTHEGIIEERDGQSFLLGKCAGADESEPTQSMCA